MKIISGGQTGADRAALDVAIELNISYGGAIPNGRMTEDGQLSEQYKNMTELESNSYAFRTEQNVVDSDATLILILGNLDISSGTGLTVNYAKKHNKPYLIQNLKEISETEVVISVKEWLNVVKPAIINIAGSRESKARGISAKVYGILKRVFT